MNNHLTSDNFEKNVKRIKERLIAEKANANMSHTVVELTLDDNLKPTRFSFIGHPDADYIKEAVTATRKVQDEARLNPYKENMLQPKLEKRVYF